MGWTGGAGCQPAVLDSRMEAQEREVLRQRQDLQSRSGLTEPHSVQRGGGFFLDFDHCGGWRMSADSRRRAPRKRRLAAPMSNTARW